MGQSRDRLLVGQSPSARPPSPQTSLIETGAPKASNDAPAALNMRTRSTSASRVKGKTEVTFADSLKHDESAFSQFYDLLQVEPLMKKMKRENSNFLTLALRKKERNLD